MNVLDCPGPMSPVENPPVMAETVWDTWSSLVTVTAVPAATLIVGGEKAKFLMVMVWEPAGLAPAPAGAVVAEPLDGPVDEPVEGLLPPEEQAASTSTRVSTAPSAVRRAPRVREREGVRGRWWWSVSEVMPRCSEVAGGTDVPDRDAVVVRPGGPCPVRRRRLRSSRWATVSKTVL